MLCLLIANRDIGCSWYGIAGLQFAGLQSPIQSGSSHFAEKREAREVG